MEAGRLRRDMQWRATQLAAVVAVALLVVTGYSAPKPEVYYGVVGLAKDAYTNESALEMGKFLVAMLAFALVYVFAIDYQIWSFAKATTSRKLNQEDTEKYVHNAMILISLMCLFTLAASFFLTRRLQFLVRAIFCTVGLYILILSVKTQFPTLQEVKEEYELEEKTAKVVDANWAATVKQFYSELYKEPLSSLTTALPEVAGKQKIGDYATVANLFAPFLTQLTPMTIAWVAPLVVPVCATAVSVFVSWTSPGILEDPQQASFVLVSAFIGTLSAFLLITNSYYNKAQQNARFR
jgi:hypothetical protein